MPRSHDLLGLAFAAMRGAPHYPLVPGTDCVHGVPKFRRDSRVGGVFQHSDALAVLDLPSQFAAELKVVALVIDRPRLVGFHVNAVNGIGNELLASQRLLTGKNTDVGHPNDWQPVPAFSPQGSAGSIHADSVRSFTRTQISRE